jgi:hypothetical protein
MTSISSKMKCSLSFLDGRKIKFVKTPWNYNKQEKRGDK